MESVVHGGARFFVAETKDEFHYTPSDCFETFPLPPGWRTDATLEDIGRRHYVYRAELIKRTQKGLTKTYNRYHERLEKHPEIVELRRLHEEMDRAVLHACGWVDVDTTCDFFPDWPPPPEGSDERQPPYRFRWPDAWRGGWRRKASIARSLRRREKVKRTARCRATTGNDALFGMAMFRFIRGEEA